MHLLASAVLLLLPCVISAQDLINVCNPDDFVGSPSDPPLPAVPNQFSATIEGNLVARGQTFIVTEYYDQVGDRGKIEFVRNGTKTVGIYDYTLGEIFLIPDPTPGGGECRVFEISPATPFLAMSFGFTEVNGSLHIGSPAAFLEKIQGTNASTLYLGEDTVRGIPVQRWQACVNLPNNTYLIDYAFAPQENWTYGMQLDDSVMIPIEFRLNASFASRRGGVDNAYNIYTFVNYASGPDSVPDEEFQVPTGLACRGRIPGQPLPALADYFSGRIELNTEYNGSKVLVTVQEYYDYTRGLFRLDFYSQTGPRSLVHDFNQGVQFSISQDTNECQVTPLADLTPNVNFDFDRTSEVPQIASPQQLSLLDDFYNYTYEGVTTIRGVEVDSWVSIRDYEEFSKGANVTNAVYEVFFSRPGLVVVNEHSVTTVPVILRVRLRGDFHSTFNGTDYSTFRDLQYDFFDISTEEPPYDAYDVSSCYSEDDILDVVLVMPGSLSGFNVGTLRENIRVAISNFTGVLPLQLASIRVFSRNDTTIAAHVRIANITENATVPDKQRINAATALQTLTDGVNAGTFTVTIPPNITVTPSIHTRGQNRNTGNNSCDTSTTEPPNTPISTATLQTEPPTNSTNSTNPPTQPPTTQPTCPPDISGDLQKQLNLKDREIIGIAIGLLFGGILVGAVLMLLLICICRCVCRGGKGSYTFSRGGNVQYEKQKDDIALD